MENSNKYLILAVTIIFFGFCVVSTFGLGLLGFLYFGSSASANLSAPKVNQVEVETKIVSIATHYANSNDLEAARADLKTLNIPNAEQYIAFMIDLFIQENRGPGDVELQNLFTLAQALGATTPSMVAILASPTPTSLPTSTPTSTPTLLPTSTSTPTALPTDTPTPVPSNTPLPTETAIPATDTATDIPIVKVTPVPVQPTNTPEPTAPPKPAFDFVISRVHFQTMPENGGCRGAHNIFVTVVDAAGNPLNGVTLEDTDHAVPPHVSGEKGPGKLEYDLYKNGYSLLVIKDGGNPVTSQISEKLSSNDWEIGIPRLIEGGYCPDEGTCREKWNSGVFGQGSNSLCWGHYSWEITFQRSQ